MIDYQAPLRDMQFILDELAGLGQITDLPGCEDASPDLMAAVLEEAGKFASGVLAPINRQGDLQGCRLEGERVITPEIWDQLISTNLNSAFYCCRAIMKHMVDRGKGRVINVSSGQGLRGQRGSFMYGCAKGGIIQLTRVLAATYGSSGITSTCIVPGMFPTRERDPDDGPNRRLAFLPMGRAGIPQDLAPLAVFLASDASDYMNGEMFYCDGGAMAGGAATTGYAPLIPLQD